MLLFKFSVHTTHEQEVRQPNRSKAAEKVRKGWALASFCEKRGVQQKEEMLTNMIRAVFECTPV